MTIKDFLKNKFDIDIDEKMPVNELDKILQAENINIAIDQKHLKKRITTKRAVCKYLVKEFEKAGYEMPKDFKIAFPELYSRYLDVRHVAKGGNINRLSFPAIFDVAKALKIKIEFIVEHTQKSRKAATA
jgi:mRNA-degrading endonuclease HigB of HigAB toxin-antitoxin module